MANVGQQLTHQMLAREAAKMLADSNFVGNHINTSRESEFGKEVQGYQKGETVKVSIPPTPVVYDGSNFAGGGSAPAFAPSSVDLTIDTQKHVPITFTAKEKKLEIADFKKNFLQPAMTALIGTVNTDLLTKMKNLTPNVVGTWGTTPATRAPWRQAGSVLSRFLAPKDARVAHFSLDAQDALAEANATLFHDSKEIKGEFSENAVGRFAGLDFFEQTSLPVHLNGAGASYAVDGAAEAGTAITVKTGTGAITKGSIITIANVYSVHPITGVSTGALRQFVVTADYAGGAGELPIYPAIVATSATVVGTVNALPADSAAITIFGTASQSKTQNLVWHQDAFASAFVPLPVLASCEGYTATVKGISVRVMTFGNGSTDTENTRIDVLYASPVGIRRDHATRVTQ